MARKTEKTDSLVVSVPELSLGRVDLVLIGDTPLIMHRWSQKAKQMILDKQMKRAKQAKEAKDPQRDFEESIYRMADGRPGFPATAFKRAAVGAARWADSKMTELRGAFHILSGPDGLVPIDSPNPPRMREDMVRLETGVADIRYRAEFWPWSAPVSVLYNIGAISVEQLVNLLNIAGFGIGVGEWRPERNGDYGRFHVAREGEV